MEENNINVVDYSNFLDSLQQSNLDIYDKVDKILTYFQEKDKLQIEKEKQELKEKEEQDKLELEKNKLELEKDIEVQDYNKMFHEELVKIENNTQYLDSINNSLFCIVLGLAIIIGIMSFNTLARFFR